MAYLSKLNCHFCLAKTFTTIRVTILTNLTTIVNWWLEKRGEYKDRNKNQVQIELSKQICPEFYIFFGTDSNRAFYSLVR